MGFVSQRADERAGGDRTNRYSKAESPTGNRQGIDSMRQGVDAPARVTRVDAIARARAGAAAVREVPELETRRRHHDPSRCSLLVVALVRLPRSVPFPFRSVPLPQTVWSARCAATGCVELFGSLCRTSERSLAAPRHGEVTARVCTFLVGGGATLLEHRCCVHSVLLQRQPERRVAISGPSAAEVRRS